MNKPTVIFGVSSEKGIRKENQDAYMTYENERIKVFAVADGMGGYEYGRQAAAATLESVKNELEVCESFSPDFIAALLNKKFIQINKYIYDWSRSNSITMGTTLSVLAFLEDSYVVCNVGDTKICRLYNNFINTLSKVHNLAAEQYEDGKIDLDEYKNHKRKNVITQCIGVTAKINPYISVGKIAKGEIYYICSDGVYNYLHEDDFLDILMDKRISELNIKCKNVTDLALSYGSNDNVTMVAVEII